MISTMRGKIIKSILIAIYLALEIGAVLVFVLHDTMPIEDWLIWGIVGLLFLYSVVLMTKLGGFIALLFVPIALPLLIGSIMRVAKIIINPSSLHWNVLEGLFCEFVLLVLSSACIGSIWYWER